MKWLMNKILSILSIEFNDIFGGLTDKDIF